MANKIIGIAGGTGSGKVTVAEVFFNPFAGKSVVLTQQDLYYKDLCHIVYDERNKINFDYPDALDNNLLINQLKNLRNVRIVRDSIGILHCL